MNSFCLDVREVRTDRGLQGQLIGLLETSYQDPSAVLAHHLSICTKGYFLCGQDRSLLAFFLVGLNYPLASHTGHQWAFLGQSACAAGAKGRGLTVHLYRTFLKDVADWQRESDFSIILWGTTIHPAIWRIVNAIFGNTAPRLDGSYSKKDEALARSLLSDLGMPQLDNPFLLPRFFKSGPMYTPAERAHCATALKRLPFDIFSAWGAKEENGDRILLLTHII